jgi:methylenetetrahydrofolate dehydrogenase (NADP+)/methenyltetrahydrofolate cyclohydrolase
LVNLLIDEGATVTCCNSHTIYPWQLTAEADVVISAIGKPKLLDEKYFSNQTLVIDVGINRDKIGRLCGDVNVDALSELDNVYITPVPGGVGLLTRVTLLLNVLKAYCLLEEIDYEF